MMSNDSGCTALGVKSIPFDGLIGVTADGVPVISNGDELHVSNDESFTPACAPLSSVDKTLPCPTTPYCRLGIKWLCVEFVRRYCAARKGVWMTQVPTAEDLWTVELPFTRIKDGSVVDVVRTRNGTSTVVPSVGDIIVWGRSAAMPFGHVAVTTEILANGSSAANVCVRIAEQNHGFEKWEEGRHYSREMELRTGDDGCVELVDPTSTGDPVMGWLTVQEPFYDFTKGNLADDYRIVVGRGTITRCPINPDPSLAWLTAGEPCDDCLRRSLVDVKDGGDIRTAEANVVDVPGAFYFLDYDMWCRINRAATSLHRIAMEATARVLNDPDAEHLLEHYFGVPPELQPLLRRAWELTPPMCGRFDFGYDGKRIVMLEYNCDSSGALLECCDTQEKMAKHYGVHQGTSTGSFLSAKCVEYYTQLLSNERVCPKHKLIHFMIDDDDEERYTVTCAMNFAMKAGFRAKLLIKLEGLSFAASQPINSAPLTIVSSHPSIVDSDGEEVLLVWKTWSWDTVLRHYSEQQETPSSFAHRKCPTLPDVLLNNNIRVLEPMWKCITGSKAILPFMDTLAPDHQNMLQASFLRTRHIMSDYHISKPINGRAGQNVIMYDPVTDVETLRTAPVDPDDDGCLSPLGLCGPGSFATSAPVAQSIDKGNESSPGRFFDSLVVYQRRVFLKKFDHKYFPIFCGWMIGDQFSGVVVREDTSKITKLASVVVPARVLRSPISPSDINLNHVPTEEAT